MDDDILEVNCENNKVHLTKKINSICKVSNENNKLHLSTELNHSDSEANNEYNNISSKSKLMIQDVFEKTEEFGYEKSLFDIQNENRLVLTQDSHSIIDKSITRIFPCARKSDAVIKNNLTSKKNEVHTTSFKLKPIKPKLAKQKYVSIQKNLNRLQEEEPIYMQPKKLIPILPKPVAVQTKPIEEQHNLMTVQIGNVTQEYILINCGKMENFEKIFPVAIYQNSDFQSIKLLDENIENESEMFILGI